MFRVERSVSRGCGLLLTGQSKSRAQQSLGQAGWSPGKKEEEKLSWGEGRPLSVGLDLSPEGLQHIHLYHSLWGYFQNPQRYLSPRKPTHFNSGVLTSARAPPIYLKPSLHHWYPLLQSKHCKLLCPLLSSDLESVPAPCRHSLKSTGKSWLFGFMAMEDFLTWKSLLCALV